MTRSFWSRRWNCPLFGFLARRLSVNLAAEPVEGSENGDVGVGMVRLVGYNPEREFFSKTSRRKGADQTVLQKSYSEPQPPALKMLVPRTRMRKTTRVRVRVKI